MPDDQPLSAELNIESVLAERGLLVGQALERVRRLEAESGERIDRIAAKLGLVSDADLAGAYAALLGSPVLSEAEFPAEPVAADRLRSTFFKHAHAVPVLETEQTLAVAMADPLDENAARAIEFAIGKTVIRRAAVPADIEMLLERLYGDGRSAAERVAAETGDRPDEDRDADLERLKDLASEAPVIRLVNSMITRAVEMRASDIHIEWRRAGSDCAIGWTGCCARWSHPRGAQERHHLAWRSKVVTAAASAK